MRSTRPYCQTLPAGRYRSRVDYPFGRLLGPGDVLLDWYLTAISNNRSGGDEMRGYLGKHIVGLMLWFALSGNAWSALVAFNIHGTIDFTHPDYAGGVGAPISGLLVADITGSGDESIALDSAPGSLTINFGSLTVTEADEDFFGSGFPLAYFTDGDVTGIDFYMTDAEPGLDLWVMGFTDFVLFDRDTFDDMVTGTLSFTPVPLPSALLLLASGLFVLLRLRPSPASV